MVKVKRYICIFITLIVILLLTTNCVDIKSRIEEEFNNFLEEDRQVEILPGNEYTKSYDFEYFQNSKDYSLTNKEDLKNIIYSIGNQGWEKFTFYCDKNYTTCIDDLLAELQDQSALLSTVGDFIHPYNSFEGISLYYDTTGKITITVKKKYTNEEIKEIDYKINQIMAETINDSMSTEEKLRALHDYIINNTKYDKNMEESGTSIYDSKRMTGLLNEHYAICSAYTDVYAVMLSKLNLENYKISNADHIWNAVKIDNKWYHVDLTWDDPITTTGQNMLVYDYFLIDNNTLNKTILEDEIVENKDKHLFDIEIYSELVK